MCNVITSYKKYQWILIFELHSCLWEVYFVYLEGYALYSISFSTLSIFISYFFIFFLWRDLSKIEDKSYEVKWFKGALVLLGISSIGFFACLFNEQPHHDTVSLFQRDLFLSAFSI